MSRILNFKASNIMRVEVLEITPSTDIVEISGKNKQGKTSAIHSLSMAIEGAKQIHRVPIREGAETGEITLTLGTKGKDGQPDKVDMIVHREFSRREPSKSDPKPFATSLKLTLADGQQPRKAQEILNGLYNSVCTDPLGFTKLQPKDQFDKLRAMVPGFDFEAHDNMNRADFNRRTDVNRELERVKAAASIISVPTGTPDELVDEAAITDAMANAGTVNGEIERRKLARATAAEKITTLRDNAVSLRARVETLRQDQQADLARAKAEYERRVQEINDHADINAGTYESQAAKAGTEADELQARLDGAEPLPDPVDTVQLQAALHTAKDVNGAVREKRRKAELQAQADALAAEAAELTAKLTAREEAKRKAISEAKLPVEGLTLGDGEILLNGFPFEQASLREQLVTSCAIAMANKPEIRIMHISDGAVMDDEGWEVLREIAKNHDFQIWVETVKPETETAIILENGKVKAPAEPTLI